VRLSRRRPSLALQLFADVVARYSRAVHKYQEAAKTEVKVLTLLTKNDRRNLKCVQLPTARPSPPRLRSTDLNLSPARRKCIPLVTYFDFHGHTCLVTPLLSCSVFDFLKDNSYEPFPLSHVQSFGRQLLTSLKCASSLS